MLKKALIRSPTKALKPGSVAMGVLLIDCFTIVKQCMYKRRK